MYVYLAYLLFERTALRQNNQLNFINTVAQAEVYFSY